MHRLSLRITLLLLATALMGVTAVAAASRPLALHPRFTHFGASDLVVGDDDAFIAAFRPDTGAVASTGVLIDAATGQRRTLATQGCDPDAIGGSWLALTCQGASDRYVLYDLADGHPRSFTSTVAYQRCSIDCLPISAIGTDWVAFAAPPEDPEHGLPSFTFQRLQNGQTSADPTDATTTTDLDGPQLAQPVCGPLQVPSFTDADGDSGWGSVTADGRFTIASGEDGAYLERCGTNMHRFLTYPAPDQVAPSPDMCAALVCAPAHNAHAIVWQTSSGAFGRSVPAESAHIHARGSGRGHRLAGRNRADVAHAVRAEPEWSGVDDGGAHRAGVHRPANPSGRDHGPRQTCTGRAQLPAGGGAAPQRPGRHARARDRAASASRRSPT